MGFRRKNRGRGSADTMTAFRLHLDGLDRYHGPAVLVMTAGSLGMMLAAWSAWCPLWAGFLAGAVPTLVVMVLTPGIIEVRP
jgi:hypothetical protein